MRITPLDIRKQDFRKAMRGLDSEEVYAFLTTVADEYEAALSDNKALRERVLELDDKVQEYRSMERNLRDTLLTAERVTADAKENARREADLIIKEAQIDAEKVLRDIKNQAMKLRREVQELRRERENYLARMKMLAESYMKFIEGEEMVFEETERKAEQAAEEDSYTREEQHTAEHREEIGMKSQEEPSQAEADSEAIQTGPMMEEQREDAQPEPQDEILQMEPLPESATLKAAPREDTKPVSPSNASIPDLNAILDRMVEGQREMLEEGIPSGPAVISKPPKYAGAEEKGEKEWSIEKIKQDILSDSSTGEDR